MLVRHALIYFVGRVVPAAASLGAIALFTRLLSLQEYGRYALAVAAAGFMSAILFQWVTLSTGRIFPQCASEFERRELLASAAGILLGLSSITIAVFGPTSLIAIEWQLRDLLLPTALVACAQGWFDLNSRLANAQLAPIRFSVMAALRGVVALALSAVLAVLGFGAIGLLVALVVGLLSATLLMLPLWLQMSLVQVRLPMVAKLWQFGSPLAITLALTNVIDVSDRFFLASMRGTVEVGVYSAAYDLTQFALGSLASVVHLAAFPLVVKRYEEAGQSGVADQLRQTALLLLGVTLPAAAGIALLAPNVAAVALGSEFQRGSAQIIAWVALAILINTLKSFYFDYSFFLGNRMAALAAVVGIAASVNVAANLVLIPPLGATGAAIATVLAFLTGLFLSWRIGGRVFDLPGLPKEAWKIVVATGVMGLCLYPVRQEMGALWLALQVALGATVYIASILLLNVGGVRAMTRSVIARSLS